MTNLEYDNLTWIQPAMYNFNWKHTIAIIIYIYQVFHILVIWTIVAKPLWPASGQCSDTAPAQYC
jgi:hypothetical protein